MIPPRPVKIPVRPEVATLPPLTIPPRFDSSKVYEAKVLHDDTGVLPGSRQRVPGEIIRQSGKIFVVTKVTQSGAVCDACGAKRVSIRDRFSDKVSEFSSPDRGTIRISSQCDASEPLEKMSDEDFANRKSGVGDLNKTGIERNNSMPKNKTTHVKNPKNKTGVNYVGRATRIEKLVANGKTDKEILEIIANEFHGSSPKLVLGCIASKRTKAKKAAGKATAAATKAVSKKTPAKPAKKGDKATNGKPAAKKQPEPAPAESTEAAPVSIPPRPGTPAQE